MFSTAFFVYFSFFPRFFASVIPAVRDSEMELKFVQIVWRHGDRSPVETFPTDPFQEDSWKFGGGGWGQLTPNGMKQHFEFGKLLRKRYVNTGNSTYNFLPSIYDSKVIYVRSTDVNRTLISAISNMLGMYGLNEYGNAAGVDYPLIEGWPKGFVPIPIHTLNFDNDCIGNTKCDCPRREWLWQLIKKNNKIKNFLKTKTLENLEILTNKTLNLDNFWIISDALGIEQIYFNETLRQKNEWFNDDLYNELVDLNIKVYNLKYGLFEPSQFENGLNLNHEILKVRFGSLIQDLYDRIDLKRNCTYGIEKKGCDWIQNLKYYAFSAHDETVFAIAVILGIKNGAFGQNGFPLYSSAVILEYWRNTTDDSDHFKVLYHKNDGDGFHPLTSLIKGCNQDYCSLNILKNITNNIKPDQPIQQWCQIIGNQSSTIFFLQVLVFNLICFFKF